MAKGICKKKTITGKNDIGCVKLDNILVELVFEKQLINQTLI